MKKETFACFRGLFLLLIICTVADFVYTQSDSSRLRDREAKTDSLTAAPETKSSTGIAPVYRIFDIGVVQAGDQFSQGFGVSAGGVAVGRSIRNGAAQAFRWTQGAGIEGLPNLAGRAFCVSNGANDIDVVAGTCATTLFGSSPLPVIWLNGLASQLPLPSGETLGRANDVNGLIVAVGSVNGGSLERAVIYSGGTATVITQTTPNGSFFVTAFGINDSGRVVGAGIDPNNAARNVGMVYDIGSPNAFEVDPLPGANGALAFGVSNMGHVVGSSMLNQGAGLPFIWTPAVGSFPIPLPIGTTQGSARAVNSAGWVVGNASSAFSIPFLYDGANTWRLADLIPAGTGWDLSMNTSSSALGISEGNVIVGTGVFNGEVHAYAMVPATVVSVSGRVLTAAGFGIPNARVTLSGGDLPAPLIAITNNFGYYHFDGLTAGQPYLITVTSRQFTWSLPMVEIAPVTDIKSLDFVADKK